MLRAPASDPNLRSAPPKAIAVLPFTDMSAARDHEWFCEGIAEEILNALTKIRDLRVITRTAAFRFKDPARASILTMPRLQCMCKLRDEPPMQALTRRLRGDTGT